MREITELLKAAHSNRHFWGIAESLELLEKLKQLGCESDWEEDESWVRISMTGSLSAMFSTKVPLAFASEGFPFKAVLQAEPLKAIITHQAFSERDFRAPNPLLEEVFQTTFSKDEFDSSAFSVSDLWYQTVDS